MTDVVCVCGPDPNGWHGTRQSLDLRHLAIYPWHSAIEIDAGYLVS